MINATRASAAGILVIAGLFGLTGCSPQLQDSTCQEFEAAWNDFAEVRDGSGATPEDVIAASETFRDRLHALYNDSGAPDDVRSMIGTASEHFRSAWIATTPSDRNSYQQSWINGRDYVARQCSTIGQTLTFNGSDVPLETPRLSQPTPAPTDLDADTD